MTNQNLTAAAIITIITATIATTITTLHTQKDTAREGIAPLRSILYEDKSDKRGGGSKASKSSKAKGGKQRRAKDGRKNHG